MRTTWLLRLGFATLAGLSAGACSDGPRSSTGDARVERVGLPYYADVSFTPRWFSLPSAVPADFHSIPAFALVDQRGATLTEHDFEGKLYVANFFFTSCPGICPTTMASMARLQEAFGDLDDVVLLSHSVTPEADSVAALQAFAARMQVVSSKWFLATGDREQIYELGKNSYFAHEDLGEGPGVGGEMAISDNFLHTESFFLIDRDRRIRGVYNGMNAAAVTQLIEDVRFLRESATE